MASLVIAQVTFHPDFIDGKAAYFDIKVRNSLQPCHIVTAATCAGAAAQAGEMEKDDCHEQNVIASSCRDSWILDSIKLEDFENHHFQDNNMQYNIFYRSFLEPHATTICQTLVF